MTTPRIGKLQFWIGQNLDWKGIDITREIAQVFSWIWLFKTKIENSTSLLDLNKPLINEVISTKSKFPLSPMYYGITSLIINPICHASVTWQYSIWYSESSDWGTCFSVGHTYSVVQIISK